MFAKWTFGKRLALGFSIGVIAIAVIGASGYRSAKALIANDELVEHTQSVRRQVAQLMTDVLDTETGQRGFVLTGKDEFLEPYNAGREAVGATYTELRRLTADNPNQAHRLDRLKPLLDAKLAEMKQVIEQRRVALETAITTVSAGEGKRTMDGIRQVLREMDDDEAALLTARKADAEASTSMTTSVILWGSLAGILLASLAGWTIARALGKQIGGAVLTMQSATTELQAAANQQASGATEQATAMTEIATTINELLATSRQIAESAQRVSHIASETATTARTGSATVVRGNDAVAIMRRQVDVIVTHMLELGKKSQQVGAVLDIVGELAEQTNILAINATIEAAGAGESGRRFGVVAAEIRTLADRVGASTKEIRGMVDDVRGAVNTTVMATEAGSKAVDAGSAQVAEMAGAFNQIATLIATTTDAVREIELSTKQQATAVEQVNVAITNAAQATRENEASASQTLQTAVQLTGLSGELREIVQAS